MCHHRLCFKLYSRSLILVYGVTSESRCRWSVFPSYDRIPTSIYLVKCIHLFIAEILVSRLTQMTWPQLLCYIKSTGMCVHLCLCPDTVYVLYSSPSLGVHTGTRTRPRTHTARKHTHMTRIHWHTCTRTHGHADTRTPHTHRHRYTLIHSCAHTCAHTHAHTHMRTYTHAHTHITHTHTHITHAHTHTCAHTHITHMHTHITHAHTHITNAHTHITHALAYTSHMHWYTRACTHVHTRMRAHTLKCTLAHIIFYTCVFVVDCTPFNSTMIHWNVYWFKIFLMYFHWYIHYNWEPQWNMQFCVNVPK